MPGLALGLYVAFAAIAFGLRSWLHRRRTGSTGFVGFSGRSASPEWWAGRLFALAVLVGLVAPVAGLLWLDPLPPLRQPWLHITGAVIATIGILLTLLAQLDLGSSWRVGVDPGERTELVTTGAFALVRNPIFSAMIVTAGGIALVAPNVVALLGFVALLVAVQLQVRVVEEPYLLATHPRAYRAYGTRVGRFVPGLGRFSRVTA